MAATLMVLGGARVGRKQVAAALTFGMVIKIYLAVVLILHQHLVHITHVKV